MGSVGIGIFASVVLQIVVLIDKLPEASTVIFAYELDFRVITRDVYQVVGQTIAIDVVAVAVAIA